MSQDPYDLIRSMNRLLGEQKSQIAEYEMALDSLQQEKTMLASETARLQGIVANLHHKIDFSHTQKSSQLRLPNFKSLGLMTTQ